MMQTPLHRGWSFVCGHKPGRASRVNRGGRGGQVSSVATALGRPCRRTCHDVSPAERPTRESVAHGATDSLAAPAGTRKDVGWTTAVAGNIQHWAEYSLPARPIYHPGTCAENDWSHGRCSRRTEGVLLGISRSTAHIAIACSFHSAEDQAFPLAAETAPQIGKPDSC